MPARHTTQDYLFPEADLFLEADLDRALVDERGVGETSGQTAGSISESRFPKPVRQKKQGFFVGAESCSAISPAQGRSNLVLTCCRRPRSPERSRPTAAPSAPGALMPLRLSGSLAACAGVCMIAGCAPRCGYRVTAHLRSYLRKIWNTASAVFAMADAHEMRYVAWLSFCKNGRVNRISRTPLVSADRHFCDSGLAGAHHAFTPRSSRYFN